MADDDVGLRVGQWAAFIAGRLPVFAMKGCARHNSLVRRRTLVGALGREHARWTRGTRGGYGAVLDRKMRHAFQGCRREGGLVTCASRRWDRASTDAEVARCPVRGTAKPAGRSAHRRRSRARSIGMAIRGRIPGTRRIPAPMGPGMGLIFHLWVRGG
jgi:hypothetical protein